MALQTRKQPTACSVLMTYCASNTKSNYWPCSRKRKCHPHPSGPCWGWVCPTSTWRPGGGPSYSLSERAEPPPAGSSRRCGEGSLWCGHGEDQSCHGRTPARVRGRALGPWEDWLVSARKGSLLRKKHILKENSLNINYEIQYLHRCCKVELPPIQVSSLSDDWIVREGVAQEVNELARDLAGENMTIFLLAAAEELKRVCPELQSTAQVGDEAVLHHRLTGLPVGMARKRWQTIFS